MTSFLPNITLGVNLLLSTGLFYIVARIYILPRLSGMRAIDIMTPLLLLHGLRHLGIMFLAAGVVLPGMPYQFAYPAALGDCLSAILAMIALYTLYYRQSISKKCIWIFNIVGTLDFILAIALSVSYKAGLFMGGSYWIPAFWVPMLLVTHYIIHIYLTRYWRD